MQLKVLYEDNHLLVISKPAGIATMGTPAGELSLIDHAKQYLKQKYDKPGEVYLGVVSRLDALVSGVILFARTSKAASRLTDAFRTREVEKTYLALVAGLPEAQSESLVHYLKKDERNQRMFATHADAPEVQRAELSYSTLNHSGEQSLLEISLKTGRKHQIRVQLSKIGLPILGDKKYGSQVSFDPGITLHSWKLSLIHPVRKEPISFTVPPPTSWPLRP